MKGYLLLAILCLSLTMPGCAWIRETAQEGIDEYVATVEAEKDAMKKLLGVWPYRSCQLRAALGSRYNWLPGEAQDSWDALDEMVGIENGCKPGEKKAPAATPPEAFDPEGLSDCELGCASGYSILLTYEVVRKAVKSIAPEVMKLLPALL